MNRNVRKRSNTLVLQMLSFLLIICCTGAYARAAKPAEEQWDLSAGMDYLSRYFRYGVDLGADQPALDWHADLSHKKGWLLGGDFVNVMDGSGFQDGSLYGGYQYDFSENFFLRGEFTHYFYSDDSANILSTLLNEISLEAGLTVDSVEITFSYERFIDGTSANYYGATVLRTFTWGDLDFTPSFNASFISQTVSNTVLTKYKQKGKKNLTLSGTSQNLSGFDGLEISVEAGYDLGAGFRAVVTPAFVYSPQDVLAFRTSQFIWTVGVAYSQSF